MKVISSAPCQLVLLGLVSCLLCEFAASDYHHHHDLTMDLTAFSLHYRSFARSDSRDLKTATRFDFPFEDKTLARTPATSVQEVLWYLENPRSCLLSHQYPLILLVVAEIQMT